MNTRLQRQRFEQRFYRGRNSSAIELDEESEWCTRACGTCGREHLGQLAAETSYCFDHQPETEFLRNARSVRMSVEAEGEDSTLPQRVREGTAQYNIGLRGIDTVVGTRPDGKPALAYRPITHNELPTARARREYAKRTNCSPGENVVKRAVGGKS